MRGAFLLLLLFLFVIPGLRAQDIITLTDGTKVRAKVLEVKQEDIKYKDFDKLNGPVITIPKNTVSEIRYANGAKKVITGNDSAGKGSGGRTGRGHFKRPQRPKSVERWIERKEDPPEIERIREWYFSVGAPLGASYATIDDPSIGTQSDFYGAFNLLATQMFGDHFGAQLGLGFEYYDYMVQFTRQYVTPSGYDNLSLGCITVPARVLYFSNSKSRAGLFVNAGFDFSFLASAKDVENTNQKAAYRSAFISPYVSTGVAFRNRSAGSVWMIGLFYKTTMFNFYSRASGNTGQLMSGGISFSYMGSFGRRY
jgi:hypothetical protein